MNAEQFERLLATITARLGPARAPARLTRYDGASKGLIARQWLSEVTEEARVCQLSDAETVALARSNLLGLAATWYSLEASQTPFEAFLSDPVSADDFSERFRLAFVEPGADPEAYYALRQSPDTRLDAYVLEKAGLAQMANIPFERAVDRIVEGLHDVFRGVKMTISHNPPATAMRLIADITRLVRHEGIDANLTPRMIQRQTAHPADQQAGHDIRNIRQPPVYRQQPMAVAPRYPRGDLPVCRQCGRVGHVYRDCPRGQQRVEAPIRELPAPPQQQQRQVQQLLPQPPIRFGQQQQQPHNQQGAVREGQPRGQPGGQPQQQHHYTMSSSSMPGAAKYVKTCIVNDADEVSGFMDTGCSTVLIKMDVANRMNLDIIPDIIPIYGSGSFTTPATYAVGRTRLLSLQIGDARATGVEALVVPEETHPLDMCIGRSFLDLPHLVFLRVDEEFLVTPLEKAIATMKKAEKVTPRVSHTLTVPPMTATLVEASTEPARALVIRAPEKDLVLHSDENGRVTFPVANPTGNELVLQQGSALGHFRALPEVEYEKQLVTSSPRVGTKSSVPNVGNLSCIGQPEPANVNTLYDIGPQGPSVETSERIGQGPATVGTTRPIGCQRPILEDEVQLGPSLTPNQRQRMLTLINDYADVFSFSLQELGCTDVLEARLDLLPGRLPERRKPYRLAPADREFLEAQVEDWRRAGIVTDTVSPFASPAFVVTRNIPGKPPHKRVVVDVRSLNECTVELHWPIPNVEDELLDLSCAKYFCSLDFMQGFMQIPLSNDSRHLTSFITPDSSGEFTRMLFGLRNGPAIFNHLVSIVLGPLRREKHCFFFFDDILVKGKSFDELLAHLERAFQRLRAAKLTLNPEKCRFGLTEIVFMGFLIRDGQIMPTEDKIAAIKEFPRPKTATHVRQFLGLCGFFRRFIPKFAQIVASLSALTSTRIDFAWGEPQEAAFNAIKEVMGLPPVLQLFDPSAPTELHTDASSIGLSGMLLQSGTDKKLHLIRCVSRKCSEIEATYHSSRLETLAIVFSLEKLRPFLIGRPFKLITDCQALLCINTRTSKNPQMARWLTLLQDFQFTVEHRAGTRMAHVDALSRNPVGPPPVEHDVVYCGQVDTPSSLPAEENVSAPAVLNIDEDDLLPPNVDEATPATASEVVPLTFEEEMRAVQAEDEDIARRLNALRKNPERRTGPERAAAEGFEECQGLLYRRESDRFLYVVPSHHRKAIVIRAHDCQGHFGVERTVDNIRRYCWFSRMRRFVSDHVHRCIPCLAHKRNAGKQPGLLNTIPIPNEPFEWVHVDHLGPLPTSTTGKQYLMVIVDRLTKFVHLQAVTNTSASVTVKALRNFIDDWGAPASITSDRGTAFTAKATQDFFAAKGIKHRQTCPRRPLGNGQVERVNGVVIPLLAKLVHAKRPGTWDRHVKSIQLLLNTSTNRSTGNTPIRLLCGFNPSVPDRHLAYVRHTANELHVDPVQLRQEAINRLHHSRTEAKRFYDRRHYAAERLSPGDIVWMTVSPRAADGRSRKLDALYRGPLFVIKSLGNDVYVVHSATAEDGRVYKTTAHIGQLRRFGNSNIAAHIDTLAQHEGGFTDVCVSGQDQQFSRHRPSLAESEVSTYEDARSEDDSDDCRPASHLSEAAISEADRRTPTPDSQPEPLSPSVTNTDSRQASSSAQGLQEKVQREEEEVPRRSARVRKPKKDPNFVYSA